MVGGISIIKYLIFFFSLKNELANKPIPAPISRIVLILSNFRFFNIT